MMMVYFRRLIGGDGLRIAGRVENSGGIGIVFGILLLRVWLKFNVVGVVVEEQAVVMAIKVATEIFIDLMRKGGLRRLVEIKFVVTNSRKNGMANSLANAGLSRNHFFKAY
ncbi:hypothetical protein Gogos_003894, partial [Gossypium gossypioides]|nr:hypothetical protein [Gossypium gossypioides]